jgi:DNA-directed RNA polymerase beta subunit
MVSGVESAKTGRRLVIQPSSYHDNHTETILYDGKSGNMIERTGDNGDQPVLATWGINRVWQMTQLTWDKQHYTHNTAGKYSITTNVGRTAGGGIKFGEMELHACASSGLKKIPEELRRRMNTIDVHICVRCNTLAQICICGNSTAWTLTSIPHSMMVFDYANLLTSGYVMKYKLTF